MTRPVNLQPADIRPSVDTVSADLFRSVMGGFVTGVCIVASAGEGGVPSGLTANSFTSVSLDPPLVSVCIDLRSRSLPGLRRHGAFAISVLAADQVDLARACAGRRMDWAAADTLVWDTGAPILARAVAALECRTAAEHVAGDHVILLGQVVRLAWLRPDAAPLTYHRGRYGAGPVDLGAAPAP